MDTPPETPERSFVYNRLPTTVSRKNFPRDIAPYVKRPKQGPPPKRSLYKIFHDILYVLPTGIPWPQRQTHRHALHSITGYTWQKRWAKDGAYHARCEASVLHRTDTEPLDPSVLHGDGANPGGKTGAQAAAPPVIHPSKGKKSSRSLPTPASSAVRSRANPSPSPTR